MDSNQNFDFSSIISNYVKRQTETSSKIEIHKIIENILIVYPELSCNHRICQSGTCLKSTAANTNSFETNRNKEQCFCKLNFYGDNCEYELYRSDGWANSIMSDQSSYSSLNNQQNWSKLYKNVMIISSIGLICLLLAMFFVGYFMGKNRKMESAAEKGIALRRVWWFRKTIL